ncbi:P-loop NTPase fold protein [Comamonas sp. MYb69]|uniref:P-loop NTPase fold protein n=1 Tax=Comamonas sp. MYb69 TaxID=1848650 RepID=UPI0030B450DE
MINLNFSNQNPRIGSPSELIQLKAFESLCLQIEKDLENSTKNKFDSSSSCQRGYAAGSGLTYFIDGTRGAGKSTFLNYVFDNLNSYQTRSHLKINIAPLLYLDPSRIEASEIILLHILKQLKRLMEDHPPYERAWEERYEKFRINFKKMAGGLHLFVSDAESLKELDPELFLDYGLDRAADSQKLRHILHETIDQVCEAYNCQALLLAIDDADTKFHNAIEVLECIRKYLDMPRLVVIVTGDMEMYSLLVQNHFQKDFATYEKGLNQDRRMQQARMVAHLEDQYLLKLFPIHRRTQLKTLYTLLERMRKDGGATFSLKIAGTNTEMQLIAAVENIARDGLYLRDTTDLSLFNEHVLKLPIRSVFQLISTYYQLVSDGIAARDAAATALRATTLTSLYRHDIEVESITEGDLHAVISAAFDLCQIDGEPDTAIYLRPQSRDETLRNANVSLAADVARLCENDPAKAITYMVSMAGSSTILNLLSAKTHRRQSAKEISNSVGNDLLQRKVRQYLSVGRKDNALNWALHATAAIVDANSSSGMQLRQGVVGVRTSRKGDVFTFDAQITAAMDKYPYSSLPVIIYSQSAVKKSNNTQRYISIFNTLGVISNLLEIEVPMPSDLISEDGVSDIYSSIFKILSKIENVHTVSMPNWGDSFVREDEIDIDFSMYSQHSNDQKRMMLGHSISMWLKQCAVIKKEFRASAVLLGKIWNRLYFSLDNISAAMRADLHAEGRCSRSMELFAWALINACLVEEVDYLYHDEDFSSRAKLNRSALNRDNPRTSGRVVIEKFSIPEGEKNEIRLNLSVSMAPLTFIIASCPLVLGLIKSDEKSREFVENLSVKLKEFHGFDTLDAKMLCSEVVWNTVGKTTISG